MSKAGVSSEFVMTGQAQNAALSIPSPRVGEGQGGGDPSTAELTVNHPPLHLSPTRGERACCAWSEAKHHLPGKGDAA